MSPRIQDIHCLPLPYANKRQSILKLRILETLDSFIMPTCYNLGFLLKKSGSSLGGGIYCHDFWEICYMVAEAFWQILSPCLQGTSGPGDKVPFGGTTMWLYAKCFWMCNTSLSHNELGMAAGQMSPHLWKLQAFHLKWNGIIFLHNISIYCCPEGK